MAVYIRQLFLHNLGLVAVSVLWRPASYGIQRPRMPCLLQRPVSLNVLPTMASSVL